MKTTRLGKDEPTVSRLGYGCMRIAGDGGADAAARGKRAVHAAVEAGYTLFDHADIYGNDGGSERLFGTLLKESPGLRDRIVLTSKCGIRGAGNPDPDAPTRYDFSADHILRSCEGSLQRLGVETLDLLRLHRPDYLMDPAEVAVAFDALHAAGKVRHFGVSNFSPSQVRMLQAACDRPLLVNQIEVNIHRLEAFEDGTLDQCIELGITPEAWCPLGGVAYPAWGSTLTDADRHRIEDELNQQSRRYDAPPSVVILAWLLRHPAGMIPLIGSTTPERIREATRALALDYTREDWYRLLEARRGRRVP